MVCAEHRLIQTQERAGICNFYGKFFYLMLEGSLSVLKTQPFSVLSVIVSAQCTCPQPPGFRRLAQGVHSVCFGDPMVWDAEMWDVPEPEKLSL